ncbi:MAG TPA: ABC transporter substrate-binding protein [Wenzhouxiangella sp.]|nr:ABC transporter substrate-binding protein [Wenzhouxiangella sp.]HLS04919.1 ABC transporter substrate-binding protein [Wenzhouxiangella sp.]
MAVSAPTMADPEGAVEIIESTTGRLTGMIEGNRDAYKSDLSSLQADVKDVLLPAIDEIYSARLVLGRHGRGKDNEEIAAFANALIGQLLDRYASALLDYNLKDRIEILPLAGNNTDRQTRVRTRVDLDSGERAPVDYVLRNTDDGWKIFDVIIEGISYVATFRSQIDQEIRKTSFDDMLKRLESGDLEVEIDD